MRIGLDYIFILLGVVTHTGMGSFVGVSHSLHPKAAWPYVGPRFCGFSSVTYAYTVRPTTTRFCMVTNMGRGVYGGQPRRCICTNASRGLSARAVLLVIRMLPTHNTHDSTRKSGVTYPEERKRLDFHKRGPPAWRSVEEVFVTRA